MRTLVVSHRTNAGNAPENTLAGIEAAIRDGAHAIEVDVRATRDGALVLLHDETLERTTGDPRPVAEVSLAEVQQLRINDLHGRVTPQSIPTLAEAIAVIDGRCALEIDLPIRGLETAIAEVVRRYQAERWTWFTAHPPQDAALLRALCPRSLVFLSVAPHPLLAERNDPELRGHMPLDLPDAIRIAASLGLHGLNPQHEALGPALIEHARARGLLVGCWTLNDADSIGRAVALGVDAITTDYPELAREIIESEQNTYAGRFDNA